MAIANFHDYLALTDLLASSPTGSMWTWYDSETDILYVNFKESNIADDGELTDDDIIVRYLDGDIVGLTILNAKSRGRDT
jgi:uncharacterized protein YuzE